MANLPGTKTMAQFEAEAAEIVLEKAEFGTNTNPTATRFAEFFNDAYRELCAAYDWWFLFDISTFATIASGTAPYAVDDTAREIMYMTIPAQQQKIRRASFTDWIANYPGRYTNVGATKPWAYIPAEDASNAALQFYLFPQSDQVYTVEYGFKKRVVALTSGSSEVMIIPPEFQNVVLNEAIKKSLMKRNDDRFRLYDREYMLNANPSPARALFDRMWLKNEGMDDYVNKFRSLDTEIAISGASEINRDLFVPF